VNARAFREAVERRIAAEHERAQADRGVTLSKLGESTDGVEGRGGDTSAPNNIARMVARRASVARLRQQGLQTQEIASHLDLTARQVRSATNRETASRREIDAVRL
jgi:DNA-binding NarL/FixJ family response regulator